MIYDDDFPLLRVVTVAAIPPGRDLHSAFPWDEVEPIELIPVTYANRSSHVSKVDLAPWFSGQSSHVGDSICAFGVAVTPTELVVGFRCRDQRIFSRFTERDQPLYDEEVVECFLCPNGDLRHYFEINVSPSGVVFDARVFSPDLNRTTMEVDPTWNCEGLRVATRVNGQVVQPGQNDGEYGGGEWSAVIAIPFTSIGETGSVWRGNFFRIDRDAEEMFTAWSPTAEIPANYHVPGRFGFLEIA